jgi:hypothetical protein
VIIFSILRRGHTERYVRHAQLCMTSYIVNKRRYFPVRIANLAYVACVAYVALCVAAALKQLAGLCMFTTETNIFNL